MEEKKRYTAEEALNLQSAAYQKGHNEGYELRKNEQPGAAWVKASEYKYKETCHRPYRFQEAPGEDYDYGEIYITEDEGSIFLDVDHECEYIPQNDGRWLKYDILEESGTPAAAREEGKLTQSRADLIREANNRDLDGVAINLDELWDEHSEYIDDDIDSLSRWAGSSVVDKEQFRTMVAQLWELFKQQKEK